MALAVGVAGGVSMVVGDWPSELPGLPAVDRGSSPMGTVVSVDGVGVLTVRLEGRLEVVSLVGVAEGGQSGGADGGAEGGVGRVGERTDEAGTGVQAGGDVAARVFLEGLLFGEPVRVVVSGDRGWVVDSGGRRYVRLFREPDGLFVNAELVRQGYASAAGEPVYAERPTFRAYERRAREVGKGVWRGGDGSGDVVEGGGAGAGDRRDSARPVGGERKEPEVKPAPASVQPKAGAVTVYVTRAGSKYHRVDCRHVRGNGVESVSVSQAKSRGLEACMVCKPDGG